MKSRVSVLSIERAFKKVMDFILLPICSILCKIGITPSQVSLFRVILAIAGSIALTAGLTRSGTAAIIIAILLDSVDGGIARLNKTESHRGAFIDKISDYTIYFSTFLAGVWLNLIGSFSSTYHVFIVAMAVILRIISQNEGKKTDWIIDPRPNLVWFMIIWYAALFLYLILSKNYIEDVVFWLNALLTVVAIQSVVSIVKNDISVVKCTVKNNQSQKQSLKNKQKR